MARFKSDFWIVADYFTQMRKDGNHVPSERHLTQVREVLDLMRVLTGGDRFTEHVDEFEKQKEGVTMCEVLDRVENRGTSIGEQNVTNPINYLWENGRGEDAKKAAKDKDFFNKLLSELMPVLTPSK